MKLCIDCKHYVKNPLRSMIVPPLLSGPIDICARNGLPRSSVNGAISYINAIPASEERAHSLRCGPAAKYFEPKSQLTDKPRRGILARIKDMIWG